jgi:4-amino-4-deoxy-L-arabinose transferase-like glycosyltransferase
MQHRRPATPRKDGNPMNNPSSQEPPPSAFRGILTALALVAVLFSQLLLYSYPMDPGTFLPISLALMAAGLGLFLWNRSRKPFPPETRIASRIPLNGRALWLVAALTLSVMTTVMMWFFLKFDRQNYLPVLTLWLGGAGCYLMAFLPDSTRLEVFRAWWRDHWKECLILALITALAAILRFYKLGEIPRVINGDEGWIGNIALSTTRSPHANPFSLWENFGGLYLQAINLAFLFLGTNATALRVIPAIAGTLAIPALYLLSRQLAGRRVALIASLLLAFSHAHMNFSRTVGVGYIQDTWLVPLELYFFLSGLQKRSALRAAAGGLLLGMHFSIYLTPQIFSAMLFVFCALLLVFFRRKFPNAGRTMAVFWGGSAVMLLPEAVYAATHTTEFFARMNTDGTFQSGWLNAQIAATGQNAVQILGGKILHAFFSLIYYPAIDFYGSLIPVLSLFTATLFLIGLGISLWRTRSENYLLLNGYFWAGTLAIGIFAIPESADSYRMLMVLPAAIFMAAVGLDTILESVGLGWNRKRWAYAGIAAFLMINLFAFNQWTYFVDFAGKCRYGGDPQTRFASYLGTYLGKLLPADTAFFLSNDIYRYGTHSSTDFLSGNKAVANVPDGIDTISPVAGDILIANPDRVAELNAWAREHPGGRLEAIYDCQTLILMSYRVP